MSLKEEVKVALRLSDSAFANGIASEVDRLIKTAYAEMNRVGICKDLQSDKFELVNEAVITYCQMKIGNPELYERYKEAWEYMIDNIRKSQERVLASLNEQTEGESVNASDE